MVLRGKAWKATWDHDLPAQGLTTGMGILLQILSLLKKKSVSQCYSLVGWEGRWERASRGREHMYTYGWFMLICTTTTKSLQSCLTLCDPIDDSPPGSPVPGILQAKNTGVDCHFLLQCMKVKSESEVAQSCLTLRDPMDCSLPGSSIHGIFQDRVLEWGAVAFSKSHC